MTESNIFFFIIYKNKLTVKGDHLPMHPGLLRIFQVPVVPSVAPKNSAINGMLNRPLNSSHMSGRKPFPMATLTLCTLSRSFYNVNKSVGRCLEQLKTYTSYTFQINLNFVYSFDKNITIKVVDTT